MGSRGCGQAQTRSVSSLRADTRQPQAVALSAAGRLFKPPARCALGPPLAAPPRRASLAIHSATGGTATLLCATYGNRHQARGARGECSIRSCYVAHYFARFVTTDVSLCAFLGVALTNLAGFKCTSLRCAAVASEAPSLPSFRTHTLCTESARRDTTQQTKVARIKGFADIFRYHAVPRFIEGPVSPEIFRVRTIPAGK